MRFIVLINLLMMLIHTTGLTETTNNLVSQDFTTGWSGTNVDTRHGNGTIAGVNGEYVESDSVSLSTDLELNKPTINNGFTITGSSNIWFWNYYTQSVTQTIKTTDDNGEVITQNRTISDSCATFNGCSFSSYTDQLIISSNTQQDYEISLRYDFSVPGTTGHYGADLKDPSLTVEYTFKEELDSTVEQEIIDLFEDFKIEDDIKFEDTKFEDSFVALPEPDFAIEEEFGMEEPEFKEEKFEEEPIVEEFDMIEEKEKEEEEPVMEMIETITEEEKEEETPSEMVEEFKEENEQEESNSETTETADATEENSSEQKEVQQKETKTVGLTEVLEKIDEQVKDIDKNLQLKNLVKLKVMSSGNLLEAYNIPFYEPRIIYEDQINIQDNRIIYPTDLVEYKQNDPIFIQKQKLNGILQKRQNLIKELQVLQNG